MRIVVALGGNALLQKGEKPSIAVQKKNAKKAMQSLLPLLKKGHEIVICHGNGPQVGNILIRVEEAKEKAYTLPLEMCVAESEGEIGYLLEQTLENTLHKHRIKKQVVTVLTQVLVDKKDPAFKQPTKPIGPFYTKAQAQQMKKKGIPVVEQKGRGWRRVVASPKPKQIDGIKIIEWLMKHKTIVIAAGGGGIPVIKERGKLKGIPAVIDKDRAAACLARNIKADILLILTGEPYAYINYKEKNQKKLKKINTKEARTYLKQGQFPKGSMGPKIEAALNFLQYNKKKSKVIITTPSQLEKVLKGERGTHIRK